MSSYKLNDISYPSVTTVLGILDKSAALIQWAANCAIDYIQEGLKDESREVDEVLQKSRFEWRSVSKEACDIGSEVHALIEVYIKQGKDTIGKLRPEVENAFLAFLEWEKQNVSKWFWSEKSVHSEKYGYAGTADGLAEFLDGRIMLIDFKSSKGFYDGYDMQICAYRNAVEENEDIKIDGQGVLRLDKLTGEPEFKEYPEYEKTLRSFLKLLDFYYSSKKRRLKNNPFVSEYWSNNATI